MKQRTALGILLGYVFVIAIVALTVGASSTVLGIPLDTFVLSVGLLLTPVPAWFLILNIKTGSSEA